VNTGASLSSLDEAQQRVLHYQRKLHEWASADAECRFCDVWNLVCMGCWNCEWSTAPSSERPQIATTRAGRPKGRSRWSFRCQAAGSPCSLTEARRYAGRSEPPRRRERRPVGVRGTADAAPRVTSAAIRRRPTAAKLSSALPRKREYSASDTRPPQWAKHGRAPLHPVVRGPVARVVLSALLSC